MYENYKSEAEQIVSKLGNRIVLADFVSGGRIRQECIDIIARHLAERESQQLGDPTGK